MIVETATVTGLGQNPLDTTPSGLWWCINSLFRMMRTALTAIVQTDVTHAKILWVELPEELPVCWGISPLGNKILIELTHQDAGSQLEK